MPELNWRLRVWTPTGSGPRIIQRDTEPVPIPGEASHIQGLGGRGLRLRITPEGECVEAVFSAKGAGILLPPLSAVQVEYLYLGNWTPLYYGEVRRGGNARDVFGEDYAIVGMSRRLEEVTLSPGFSAPEQAAHLTVRAIIQDVIASGQLGTPALVQYVESLCPDLGFNCRKIVDAAQQNPAALLKQIAEDGAKYGVLVRWGIDPQRRFFCRPAKSDTRDVSTEAPVITWTPPVAETPVTAVLWYVARRPDGSWITYLSRSTDANTYGDRVKGLSVDASVPTLTNSGFSARYSSRVMSPDWTAAQENAFLNDGSGTNYTANSYLFLGGGDTSTNIELTYTLAAPTALIDLQVYIPLAIGNTSDTGKYVDINSPDGRTVRLLAKNYPERGFIRDKVYSGGTLWPAGTTITFRSSPLVYSDHTEEAQILLWRVRPQRPDAALLDGLAAFHYVSPVLEPADIQTVLFVPPVSLPGRVRVTPAVGAVYEHPLEAVEYRITSNGMQMGWLAGQADDPQALAQASLIKQRDAQAVITSLTALT